MIQYLASHVWWEGFSWEAFTSLLAGGAAVLGAIWIGVQQVQIAKRQADIAERQAETQDYLLKVALHDQRQHVLMAVFNFALDALNDRLTQAGVDNYTAALGTARFVFDDPSFLRLVSMLKLGEEIRLMTGQIEARGENLPLGQLPEHREKLKEELRENFGKLQETFDDMILVKNFKRAQGVGR